MMSKRRGVIGFAWEVCARYLQTWLTCSQQRQFTEEESQGTVSLEEKLRHFRRQGKKADPKSEGPLSHWTKSCHVSEKICVIKDFLVIVVSHDEKIPDSLNVHQ